MSAVIHTAIYVTRTANVYSPEDALVPVPAALAHLVRGEKHWARVLSHIANTAPFRGSNSVQYDAATAHHECLRLAAAGQMHTITFAVLVQQIVPTGYCRQCQRPFLCESTRRQYCTERCRRLAASASAVHGQTPAPLCASREPAYALGADVRALRMAAGESQSELARALGVCTSTINKWETGVNRIARRNAAAVLAHYAPEESMSA